jgi:hypothetical protein
MPTDEELEAAHAPRLVGSRLPLDYAREMGPTGRVGFAVLEVTPFVHRAAGRAT